MAWIFLDSGPAGLVTMPKANALARSCQAWLLELASQGHQAVLPEIVDYELRRELLRANKAQGLARLDSLKDILVYWPLTTEGMILAARFWAQARQVGRPTAEEAALDVDVILAAQAQTASLLGEVVIVATTNRKHLAQFVDARLWQDIT